MKLFTEENTDNQCIEIKLIIIHASTLIFFIISGIPCIQLICNKNPSTKNISIIPGLSSYFLVVLYLGYHIITYIDGSKKPFCCICLIFCVVQLLFILVWNFIYLWYSSFKQKLKMINKYVLLLGVGVDTGFIGALLKKENRMKWINIFGILPNIFMFVSCLQLDVFKKGRYESINIYSSIYGIIHSALCIIFILSDWNDERVIYENCKICILIPNIIGCIVSLFYIIVYYKFKNRKNYEHTKVEY